MTRALIGIIIGLIIGGLAPLVLMNAKLSAVVLIVSVNSIIGGFRANLESNFSDLEMISGFVLNLAASISLLYLGDYLIVNLYYLALFALGLKIFKNLSKIRQHLIKKI